VVQNLDCIFNKTSQSKQFPNACVGENWPNLVTLFVIQLKKNSGSIFSSGTGNFKPWRGFDLTTHSFNVRWQSRHFRPRRHGSSQLWLHLKSIFVHCLYFSFSTHKRCILSQICAQQHCYAFPKNLIPWRDSNPGLMYLRRVWCPLRHAARASAWWRFFFKLKYDWNISHSKTVPSQFFLSHLSYLTISCKDLTWRRKIRRMRKLLRK
jgi:hypothetical protein